VSVRLWFVSLSTLVLLVGLSLGATGCPLIPSPTPTGNAAAGQTLFENQCVQCHTFTFLQDNRSEIVTNLGSLNSATSGITLTDQQVADLKAFLSQ
jgi:mono/diheme cytochrome c family protein